MKKISLFFFMMFSFSRLLYGQITWSSATTLSGTGASSPLVVSDPNANATAAWLESGVVKASSLPFGGSWSSSTALSSSGASSPVLTVDPSGNVTAVWQQGTVITSATLPFGGSWGSAVSVSSSGASAPSIDVDASGNVVAVWVRNGYVETATQLFGSSWGLVSMLSPSNSTNPKIAIGNGTAVVSWTTIVAGTTMIQAASGTVGGSWNSPESVSTGTFYNDFSNVDVDANGNAVIVWYQYSVSGSSYSNVSLMASYMPESTMNWNPPVNIYGGGTVNPANLVARVGFDSKGNAITFWSTSAFEDSFTMQSSILPVGGTWSLPAPLTINDLYSFSGDVAANAYGDAVAVYMSFDGTNINIVATESDIGGVTENFWSGPIQLSSGPDNAYPRVASTLLNGAVNAFAVWATSDGVNNTIVASNGSRTLLLPPTSPVVSQSGINFGVFTDYVNTFSWTLSTDPNTVGYLIFRDGVYFGKTDQFTSQAEDHIQVNGGSVTYSVVGYDMNFTQSTAATATLP